MSDETIAALPDPSGFSPDARTDLIRNGARKLIEQAIGVEPASLLEAVADKKRGRAGMPASAWAPAGAQKSDRRGAGDRLR